MKKTKLFILALLATFSVGAWGTNGSTYVTSFEEATNSYWKKNGGTAGQNTVQPRTGSKVGWHCVGTASSEKRVDLYDYPISYTKGENIHLIFYARTSASITKFQYSLYLGSELGKTNTTTKPNSSWQRYSTNGTYTGNKTTGRAYFYSTMPNKNDTIYVDDVIIYVNSSSTTDLTAPTQATAPSATTESISWTNGSDTGDGATGIQKTLIFHRTGGSVGSNDLSLNDQGIYSLTSTEGPSVVGNWTLITASIASSAISYDGTFVAGDEYAIVHRDLAYNYSTPTYVTATAASPMITKFVVAGIEADIDQSNRIITAEVPYQTAGWPNLTPVVTISAATSYSPSGAQDFSSPVTYTVTDGTNSVDYTATITRASASTDATLSAISVGDDALDMADFTETAGVYEYDYVLTYGTTEVPTVTYTKSDENASVVKTDAANVNGTTTLVVTAEDGTTTKTYKINFSVPAAASTDATLSDLKVGGTTITGFSAATTEYNYNIGVYETIPEVTYTVNDANASVDYTAATNATLVATIDVTAEDGTTTKTYTVTFVRAAATTPTVVNESKTWDFKNKVTGSVQLTSETLPTVNDEFLYADLPGLTYGDGFDATALVGVNIEWAYRSSNKCAQNGSFKFTTGVTGRVEVTYSNTGGSNKERWVTINGTQYGDEAQGTTEHTTPATNVPVGEVIISASNKGNAAFAALRFFKIVFTQTYAVNIAAATNGSVSVDKALAAKDDEVTITATPSSGYHLDEIIVTAADNSEVTITENKFTMPAQSVTVIAKFAEDGTTSLDDVENKVAARKYINNGILYIEHDGRIYNVMGVEVK